ARIDLEAAVVGERRVEQAQRMRESQLALELHLVAPAEAPARRRPFADAVEGHHRGFIERRRKERAAGVRFVVLGEDAAALVLAVEALADLAWDVELLAQPERHRPHERGKALRRVREVGLEQALE